MRDEKHAVATFGIKMPPKRGGFKYATHAELIESINERLANLASNPYPTSRIGRLGHAEEVIAWVTDQRTVAHSIRTDVEHVVREAEKTKRFVERHKRIGVENKAGVYERADAQLEWAHNLRDDPAVLGYVGQLEWRLDQLERAARNRLLRTFMRPQIKKAELENARVKAQSQVPPKTVDLSCSRCHKRARHFDDLCKRCANEVGSRPTGPVR